MQSDYLSVALDAVKAAEKVVLKYFTQDIATELKDDMSPVTIADREAEDIIRQTIAARFPDHTFYGEEGSKVDLTNHKGYTWIIDPIDGTKNYIRGNPIFGTLLALMHDGEIILGVSNAPAMNEMMWAEKGTGAFVNGKPAHVSKINKMDEAYMSFGSLKYFNQAGTLDNLLTMSYRMRWARGIGDFWGYHLLAQGKIDAVAEGKTKLWDIAPAKIIVEEAGGRFTQLDGSAIDENATTTLATNGLLHDELLAGFKD